MNQKFAKNKISRTIESGSVSFSHSPCHPQKTYFRTGGVAMTLMRTIIKKEKAEGKDNPPAPERR